MIRARRTGHITTTISEAASGHLVARMGFPVPVPTLNFTATPAVIGTNETSLLTWSTTSATSVTAAGAWGGAKALSGSEMTSALGADAVYTLTASGAGGTTTRSVTVAVAAQYTLDFAGNSYFTPSGSVGDPVSAGLISIARNSVAYAENADGSWTQFAANVLRRTNKGILRERKSINIINNQNTGAVASGTSSDVLSANVGTLPLQWSVTGFPTGLYYQVLALGTDSALNLPYIDIRISGTAGADATPALRFCPSGSSTSGSPLFNTGDLVVSSCFLAVRAGQIAPNMYFDTTSLNGNVIANKLTAQDTFISGVTSNDTSADAYMYVTQPASVPSTLARYESPAVNWYSTCDNGRMLLQFNVTNGTFYDFTLRLAMPQMERVPSIECRATSPIYSPVITTTWTAAVTSQTSNTVATANGLQVGQVVSGTGVPYATVITNITGNTITMNKAITVTNGGQVRFTGGVREVDQVQLAGGALTLAQGSAATLKVTTGAFPYRAAFIRSYAKGLMPVEQRSLPILGLNGSGTLIQREVDGSISTAYGAGAQTFRTFLGNYTAAREHTVGWSGSALTLSSAATGDVISKSSTATTITSIDLGGNSTVAMDGYITKLTVAGYYASTPTVNQISADIAVYGAKPGGIVAAYRAKKEGRSVAIVGDWREYSVGGMMAGGLGFTDYVDSSTAYVTSGSTASGSTTMILTSVSGITRGTRVTSSAVVSGTFVKSINTGTNTITLSAATTATLASGVNILVDIVGKGSISPVLRATTTVSAAIGATQLTLDYVDNWMVGASVIQNTPTGAIAYDTTITAINTGTNTITLSKPLRAALASGQIIKSWTEGGYGGLARWVFTRSNRKTLRPDDELYGEPRAFRAVFEDMLCEAGIPVYYTGGVSAVSKSGAAISSFTTNARVSGSQQCAAKTISASVIIGADYEGDFMPLAGISYAVGREANSTYGEQRNGFDSATGPSANGGGILQPTMPDGVTSFNVDPWVTAGNTASGLLIGMEPMQVLATTGSGSGTAVGDFAFILADHKIYRWNGGAWVQPAAGDADSIHTQAYNFRVTATRNSNRKKDIFSGTTTSMATTATTTAGATLTFASTASVAVGYGVFGSGIPYGTTITAKTATTITINATVTVASGTTISFLNPVDFGFSAARAELFIRTVKAFDDAATAAARTFTAGVVSSQTSGQWGICDFIVGKAGIENGAFLWDCNNVGGFGLDYIGGNRGYLAANYTTRETIWRDHINHTLCLWWTLQFYVDARIRSALQTEARLWGFDIWSYTDNLASDPANFNPQLYVREGRRMKNLAWSSGGDAQYTEEDVSYADGVAPRGGKSIAIASYALDSHQMQRLPVYNGGNYTYWNEGGVNIFAGTTGGALGTVYGTNKRGVLTVDVAVPAASECSNYATTFHGALSHVAFGGFRMEPTSMAVGEAVGLLAAMAVEGATSIQSVTYGDDSTPGTFRYRLLNGVTGAPTKPVAPLVN